MSEDTLDMIKRALEGEEVYGMLDIRSAKVVVTIRNGVVIVEPYKDEE